MKKVLTSYLSLITAFIMNSCGGISSQTEPQESTAINAKIEKSIDSSNSGTLSISVGSAKGAEITIPADALSEGEKATFTLDRVDQPTEFNKIQEGQSLDPASKPVEITATDASGNKITQLAQPMSINLPYNADTALHLDAVEKAPFTLCAVLFSAGQLYVWRNKDLTVDVSTQKVAFKSKNLGIFQLFYCGEETVTSIDQPIKEASDSEIIENDLSFSLTIDNGSFDFTGESFCMALVEVTGDNSKSAKGIYTDTLSTTSQTLSINLKGNDLKDDATHFIALMTQTSQQTCTYKKDEAFDPKSNYISYMQFSISKSALSTESSQKADLGSGDFSVGSAQFKIGIPSSTQNLTKTPEETICFTAENDKGKSYLNTESDSNDSLNDLEQITMYWPNNNDTTLTTTYNATIGQSCEIDLGTPDANAKPYSLNLNTTSEDIYYIFPLEVTIGNSSIPENSNVCLSLFTGDILSQFDLSLGTNETNKLTVWSLVNGNTYTLFLPYDTQKVSSNNNPLYDFHLLANDTCPGDSSEFGVVADDQELDSSISL